MTKSNNIDINNNDNLKNYPYEVKTEIPKLEFEEFNGAKFGIMLWKAQENKKDNSTIFNEYRPKGRIFLIHGFGEYTQIQYRLMDTLSMNGWESFTFDQRGAGVTSMGKQKGITNEFHTFNDLEYFIEKNLTECKELNIPLFLWGHSMGGGICLNYACQGKNKDKVKGYIGSGPLIVLHKHTKPNKMTRIISPILAKYLPNTTIDTGLDLEGITTDKEYRFFLQHDKPMSVPLYGSFRQIYDFMERGEKLYKNKNNYIGKNFAKDKPVIIMHGKDDTINDPAGSEKFINDCPSTDKTLKLYPGMRHSIFSLESEQNFNTVYKDLEKWLDDHLN